MSRRGPAIAILVAVLLSTAACSTAAPSAPPASTEQAAPGDIPDSQVFVTIAAPSGRWSVRVPEGWAERTSPGGFVYADKLNQVSAIERSATAAATTDIVRSRTVPELRRVVSGFVLRSIGTVHRRHADGTVLRYLLDSAKDPVTGRVRRLAAERYAFFRGGHEVLLTLTGAVGADNVDPWRTVTDSFTWS